MNLLEKPYTCPTASGEAKEDAATPEKEYSILSWTIHAFNLITGFLWAFDANLE
jgi:hypothetical protein